MEFPSCCGSSDLLGNSIAVEGISGSNALGAWPDTTSERLHSYMAMKSASAGAAILDSVLTKTEGGWEVEISIRA
jgi:hypothetical protein